jgi:sarcosine oxidase gamma subunit
MGSGDNVVQLLQKNAGDTGVGVAITDVTHGRADLVLVGPKSPVLLSRICALDLHPGNFSNLMAKQGSVAQTRQLILHQVLQTPAGSPLPAYSLIGPRSLAHYLWNVILEAGRDLAIRPVGQATLVRITSGG